MSRTGAAIKSDFFDVLKTDSAGAAFRSQLVAYQSSAASIVDKQDVTVGSLPAFPFIALQWDIEDELRTGLRKYFPVWWLYDSVSYRYRRLDVLVPLAQAAYAVDAIVMCHLDFLPRRNVIDTTLGHIPGKSFPFEIRTRG